MATVFSKGKITAKKYTSSKKSVATINSKGKVTAVKEGTSTITVTDSNKKHTSVLLL